MAETLDTAKQKATELRDKAGQKAIEVREKATEYRGKAAAYYERAEERAAEVRAKAGENLEKVNDVVNKLFLTDKEEYKHMKAIAGVVAGIVAGGILYMLLYFFYHVNELIALYITLPCTAILCLGLALWTPFRAVVILGMTFSFILALPTLTTEKGRTAIYSLIFALLLTGPVANISANLHLISDTMACSADLARNQTAALKQQLQDPINKIKDKMDSVASTLSAIGDALNTAFSPIYSGLQAVTAGLAAAKGALNEASYACTQMFTSAYTDCSNGINKAYSDCKSTLDSIPVIGRRKRDVEVAMERLLRQENLFTALQKFRDIHIKGINPIKGTSNQTDVPLEEEDVARFWEWYIEKGDRRYDSSLNEDVLAIRNVTGMAEGIFENDIHFPHHRSKRGLSAVCEALNVGALCDALKFTSGVCTPVQKADELVTIAANKTKEAFDIVKEWFNVKVYKTLGIEGLINATKTAGEIKDAIQQQLTADTAFVVNNLSFLGNLLALLLLWLLISSAMFLRSYVSRDDFKNIFITDLFREYDRECFEKRKRIVLPLKKVEKKLYIDTSSILLTAVEFKSNFVGLAYLLLHMIICIIVVFFDYVFYYVVYLVERYGNIEIDLSGSSSIVLEVQGDGEIAKLLQALISDINIQNTYNADLNFTTCLPVASLPESTNMILYGVLYLIGFGTIIVQSYGSRAMRKIAAYFYPRQEKERIIYLHKKILFKRQGRKKFQFQHMRTRRKERDASNRLAISRKIANRVPAMTSVLKVDQRTCLSCEEKETDGPPFYTCPNVDCYADYCEECFQDMNNVCVICNPPTVTYEKADWEQ